jgi:hypothetical protein
MPTDRARTQAELEATFRDVTDPSYHEALEHGADGQGWDPVAAKAATLARTSRALQTNGQAFYLLPHSRQLADPASGARKASGRLLVRRAGTVDRELRIPAGKALRTAVRDSRGALAVLQEFVLGAEVVFEAGSVGPVEVTAIATRPGNQGNVAAGSIVGFQPEGTRSISATSSALDQLLEDTGIPDVFTAGDVGRYVLLTGELLARRVLTYQQTSAGRGIVRLDGDAIPIGAYTATLLEWDALGVLVEQPEAFDNGRHAQLDAIGRERGIPRGQGEADLDYAYRISSLPDVVSAPAIERQAAIVLSPLEVGFALHETGLDVPGFVLDHSPLDAGSNCTDAPWSGATLLNQIATKRFFVLCVDPAPNLASLGLPFDANNAGLNAFDVARGPGDGVARGYREAMQTLFHAVDRARAAGVLFRIVQRSTYVPWQLFAVDVELVLAAATTPYEEAAELGLRTLFQLTPPNTTIAPWQLKAAVEQALSVAGLATTPVTVVTPALSLTPAPRRVFRLGALSVST